MIAARQLLHEVVSSLREEIAPAVTEPYPKAQAYMAAVILEFVVRQVQERGDIEAEKDAALGKLFSDLLRMPGARDVTGRGAATAAGLCEVIEGLYAQRERLGEEIFAAVNQRVRQALRHLLDQDLKIAGKAEG